MNGTWQIFKKKLRNKNPKFNNSNIGVKHKESVLKTGETAASAFNEYFATVGPNLANL